MFAHQVIDDLRQSNYLEKEQKERLIAQIKASRQFHVGDIAGFDNLAWPYRKETLFCGNLGDVWLPYPVTWFDFTDSDIPGRKLATLLREHDKQRRTFLVIPFFFLPKSRRWCASPFLRAVALGEPGMLSGKLWDVDNADEVAPIVGQAAYAVNISLLLLSCRNIELRETAAPEKLNRKRKRSGRQPVFSFYTLRLVPVTRRQKSIPAHLWHNRIHLYRGHFKSYSPEKPLFGKLAGRYWWQWSVRGNKELGAVDKDYNMERLAAAKVEGAGTGPEEEIDLCSRAADASV